ncbi:MAG: TMEM165/GDT1 family protein [Synechococcus sp. SB0662_bin_45]|uniref:GDT1 family protein n=1 Tax=Synechococcus sp. SB0676_bin_10 TaxID=2604869 RepID=A0A6B1FB38_9SYNE|nr:TMEM165/GDT1 family protein [Cyanobacteria bacterium MAG IRC3_bin_20]MCY3654290.1 TMEM165/GDT1 family protein [Cyanobacteria bacterium MAG IRC1_bin_28]MDE0647745.1 TMEM165/GDT1 family protein [Cyanobacteria bacterium MAG IRC4_bin_6]MXW13225.1 TMEM165/GDT1 family protein [Synechococcus sp. SB0668_bin_13]MXX09198.1 TMEM165/GDT1 family protein [Synechococcus sp. SB0667_bin_8]MXY19421.1 TMEM165/GDT1 family protein [Synechococcus sp. SB0664_bin_36]MYE21036.1 TMEM165/GDT1 family protein [Synecho
MIPSGNSRLAVLVGAFITVFLAELGDKTQLATLMLAAQSNHPWQVFLGAGAALMTSSLLGVLLGQWLGRILPQTLVKQLAGALMVVLGLFFCAGFGVKFHSIL